VTPARERRSLEDVREVLETARTVAVLGFNPDESRPAYWVPAYMHEHGYRIVPVNPMMASRGESGLGEPARESLAAVGEPVDVVDVFRRAEVLGTHLEDILAMEPRPKLVWLQLGIRNDEFTRALLDAGIEVVQDRCMLADHKRLGL
jgi:predicted CoA-binding protein